MTSTRSSRKERTHSQFSRMFRWELRNNCILNLFYVFAVLVMMPGSTLLSVLSNRSFYSDLSNWTEETPEMVRSFYAQTVANDFGLMLSTAMCFLIIMYALCFCGKSFGYMHTRRSVDLFHAMPIQRSPMLMGKYLALLVSMEVPLAVGAALCQLIVMGYHIPVENGFFLNCFGVLGLMSAACLTFAMLFMVISGTMVGAFLSMFSVTVGWPVTVAMVDHTMKLFLPGYVSKMPAMAYTLFCPAGAIYQCFGESFWGFFAVLAPQADMKLIDVSNGGENAWFIVWWAVMTVVMLAVSLFYYNRRKSESAENHFSFPVIRGLIRGMLSVAMGLGFGYILGDMLGSNKAYVVGIVAAAAVTHIVYQFVLTHSFAGFWKTIPAFCVCMALTGGFLYSLYQGGWGYVMRIPDAAQVEKAEFDIPTFAADGSKEAYLAQWNNVTICDKKKEYIDSLSPYLTEEKEIAVLEDFHRTVLTNRFKGPYLPFGKSDYLNELFVVTYHLKEGGTLIRRYQFPILKEDTEVLQAMAAVQGLDTVQAFNSMTNAAAKNIYSVGVSKGTEKGFYEAVEDDLSAKEQRKLWESLLEEMDSPRFNAASDLMTTEEWLAHQKHSVSNMDGDWSGWGEEWEEWYDSTAEEDDSYYINFEDIAFDSLNDTLKEKIQSYLASCEEERAEPEWVSGFSIRVPKCCEKTRQLMDDFSGDKGAFYGEEIDED